MVPGRFPSHPTPLLALQKAKAVAAGTSEGAAPRTAGKRGVRGTGKVAGSMREMLAVFHPSICNAFNALGARLPLWCVGSRLRVIAARCEAGMRGGLVGVLLAAEGPRDRARKSLGVPSVKLDSPSLVGSKGDCANTRLLT